jgi:hypothetical protein
MDEKALKAEHEAGLALFLEPSSRDRFRNALTSSRARSKFTAKLAHFAHLDPRFATKVGDKSLVAGRLHDLGAQRVCYVMSEDSEIDARFIPLSDAIQFTIAAAAGSLISCHPGRLGCFVGEERHSAWVLQRRVPGR